MGIFPLKKPFLIMKVSEVKKLTLKDVGGGLKGDLLSSLLKN
jgi:hypothetical protein